MPRPTADQLKQMPLFASVSNADRELIAQGLDISEVAPGSAIISEGQPNRAFYLVKDGQLDVSVGSERRQTLNPGAFFGEISLARGTPATASVVARTQSTLFVLDEAAFQRLMQNTQAVLRIKAAMTDREAADRLFGALPKN